MPIHPKIISTIRKDKKYFVILQGLRGSGKTQFATELKIIKDKIADNMFQELQSKKMQNINGSSHIELSINTINSKRFVICSIDDFYLETGIEFGKNLSKAYTYCKSKAKEWMNKGYSIIYNNTNLDNNQFNDIVQEAYYLEYCRIKKLDIF